jgi:hypothetical protein
MTGTVDPPPASLIALALMGIHSVLAYSPVLRDCIFFRNVYRHAAPYSERMKGNHNNGTVWK